MRTSARRGLIGVLMVLGLLTMQVAVSHAQATRPKSKRPAAAQGTLLDLNTATKDQLMTLPGITAVYAQKIIDGRPYQRKRELRQKQIIPVAEYKKIAAKVSAKPPAK